MCFVYKSDTSRSLPDGPGVKNLAAEDTRSIPGQGTKIPHAPWQLSPRIQSPCSTTREAAAVRSLHTAMKRVAPLITSRERPPLTATVESRCIEKSTHRNEESGPAHHKWRATPLVETRVAPAHCNWRKSTQQQRPSTAKNKSEKESDTSQVFRNYNVS